MEEEEKWNALNDQNDKIVISDEIGKGMCSLFRIIMTQSWPNLICAQSLNFNQ